MLRFVSATVPFDPTGKLLSFRCLARPV